VNCFWTAFGEGAAAVVGVFRFTLTITRIRSLKTTFAEKGLIIAPNRFNYPVHIVKYNSTNYNDSYEVEHLLFRTIECRSRLPL
jgi:hypothetical protein